MHDMPDEPTLPKNATANDAVRYIRALVRWIGVGFHPDENFHSYVNTETQRHSFGIDQATRLNIELDRAICLLDGTGVDVYDVGIRVQHRMYREMGYLPAFNESGQTPSGAMR